MEMTFLKIAEWTMAVSCNPVLLGQTVNFRPFLCEATEGEADCHVWLDREIAPVEGGPLQEARPDGRVLRIWKKADGIYIHIVYPDGVCRLHADAEWKNVETDARETDSLIVQEMNDVLMLAFAYSMAYAGGVLIHSSCVGLDNGRGAAFIGHSGIGKSTHSRLWLRYVPASRLINDDQPAVRVMPDGRIFLFGTPWSGKTPCYRDDRAALKAIFCMRQAEENRLVRMDAVKAFGELLKSTSMMRCDLDSYRKIVQTLSTIVERVPIYRLENRPEKEAVDLSYGAVREI